MKRVRVMVRVRGSGSGNPNPNPKDFSLTTSVWAKLIGSGRALPVSSLLLHAQACAQQQAPVVIRIRCMYVWTFRLTQV